MNRRTRGALAFLVLAQGYGLATGDRVGLPAMAGTALAVGAVAAGLTYGLAGAKGINGASR